MKFAHLESQNRQIKQMYDVEVGCNGTLTSSTRSMQGVCVCSISLSLYHATMLEIKDLILKLKNLLSY